MSLRDIADTKPKQRRLTRALTGKQVRAMKKRGYDAERELVEMMRNSGFDAIRVPVSAPSKEALPDVFAVKGSSIIAFEVKSQIRYAYYKRDQVSKLQRFLEIHRIYPRKFSILAAKFKYQGWYFCIAERLDDYTLKIGEGISFRELLSRIT